MWKIHSVINIKHFSLLSFMYHPPFFSYTNFYWAPTMDWACVGSTDTRMIICNIYLVLLCD